MFGISDDENFLQDMFGLYAQAKEAVDKADQARVEYKGPETAMDKAIANELSRIESDKRAKERIDTLSRETGLSYEEALQSYLILLRKELIDGLFLPKYGWRVRMELKSVEEKLYPKLFESNNSWKLISGNVCIIEGASITFLFISGLYRGAKASICIPLGVFGLVLTGLGIYITNDYIQEQAKKADVIFKIQRMQNVASALKQVGRQIVSEPNAVLDSNVLITAIDERRDNSNGKRYEEKWAIWRWWNKDKPVGETWCRFTTINNLTCAPKLKDYTSRDGRSVKTYITLFGRLMNKY